MMWQERKYLTNLLSIGGYVKALNVSINNDLQKYDFEKAETSPSSSMKSLAGSLARLYSSMEENITEKTFVIVC